MLSGIRRTAKELWGIFTDVCIDNSDRCVSARRSLLISNYLTMLAQSVTTGTFFTAMLLLMGADDVYIGYVTMATTICSFAQFFAPLFWERIAKRKPLIILFMSLYHLLTYLGMTIVPFLPVSDPSKLVIYLIMTILAGLFNNFNAPALNAWTMQSIPFIKRVNFTSMTSLVQTIINVICVFVAGVFLDHMEASAKTIAGISPTLFAIFVLRIIACIAIVIVTLLHILHVKEFAYDEDTTSKGTKGLSMLILPLKNRAFISVIIIPCLWMLFGGIIGNYFALHLIDNVKMSYTLITSANIISTPIILLTTPFWALMLKKYSWIKIMGVALFGHSVAYICNVFITGETQYFYFIAIVIGHLFAPCISMVQNNLLYLHLPETNRTTYFSFYTLMSNLFVFFGQTIGTFFVKNSGNLRFEIFGVSVNNLQMTSGIAALCGFMLVIYTFWYAKQSENMKT